MRLFEGTEFDRPPRCDVCGQLEADCQCPPPPPLRIPPEKQTAKISVERRKKGKTVTVIRGLPAVGNDRLANDVTRVFRSQEYNQAPHILRGSNESNRHGLGPCFPVEFLSQDHVLILHVYPTRRDRVNANTFLNQF